MLTMRRLLELIQSGNWFTTINLKGVYFHVKVAPKHRKFLCFAFQGIAYDYNRLLFDYSPSPCTFSKCVDTALQLLCNCGESVVFYLDNLIVMARSRGWAIFHTARLVLHLTQLGFAINWKKSARFGQAAGCSVRTQMDGTSVAVQAVESFHWGSCTYAACNGGSG